MTQAAQPRDAEHGCPAPELLAAYVDGTVAANERAELERHLVACPDCRDAAFAAADLRRTDDTLDNVPRRRWVTRATIALAAAAALLLAFRVYQSSSDQTDRAVSAQLASLITAVSATPMRLVDGRLTGFSYGLPPIRLRAAAPELATPAVRVEAGRIEQSTRTRRSATDTAALGIAQLALGDLDAAVLSLSEAAQQAPESPTIRSDLSAAFLARASRTSSADDAQRALESADRALSLAPHFLEALFNRALALEMLQRRADAATAWHEYIRADPHSSWSDEARSHIDRLH
jgi:tetratricopeptide (TPR) repeat protein